MVQIYQYIKHVTHFVPNIRHKAQHHLLSMLIIRGTQLFFVGRAVRNDRGHLYFGVACKTIYFAKLYILHRKSTVPFVLACAYVLF